MMWCPLVTVLVLAAIYSSPFGLRAGAAAMPEDLAVHPDEEYSEEEDYAYSDELDDDEHVRSRRSAEPESLEDLYEYDSAEGLEKDPDYDAPGAGAGHLKPEAEKVMDRYEKPGSKSMFGKRETDFH